VHVQAKVIGFDNQTFIHHAGLFDRRGDGHNHPPHKTGYLYSSFRNNGEDGLHLACKHDGLTFTALKGDASIPAPAGRQQSDARPQHLSGPDGMFHMVWTPAGG